MLGGEHGKLKHGPPQGHSAVVESLMPKDRLRLEPCFVFGEVSKNILSGPTEITDYVPFVPKAIDTANVINFLITDILCCFKKYMWVKQTLEWNRMIF